MLGEIGNILERGSDVVGSLRRGLGSLRKGVGIMLMRDDVMRQEGETLEYLESLERYWNKSRSASQEEIHLPINRE